MKKTNRLIHIGKLANSHHGPQYLFLREEKAGSYVWYREEEPGNEKPTDISGKSPEEAIRRANNKWKLSAFEPIHCGMRYDLDPRDEHGINAMFYQMVQSYDAHNLNGSYWDERAGHRCYVDFASQEAIKLWHQLEQEKRL